MDAIALGRRFLESTRGQIVAILRQGEQTVEGLSRELGITDNAVRNQLGTLERDGIIRQAGVRRHGGAGKPAMVYEIHPDAVPLFSRAYPPVLSTVLDVLHDELPPERTTEVMREIGRRLARSAGGPAAGDLATRMNVAAGVLEALGGEVELVNADDGHQRIRGFGCPLSAAVCHRPEVCLAVETMLSEIIGMRAHSCCEHGKKPRCCFEIRPALEISAPG